MLTGKKIIFVGPLGNPDDNYLKKFHYVIRTNGFFGISNKVLKSNRCDVLVVNKLYSTKHHDVVRNNLDKLKFVFVSSLVGYSVLCNNIPEKYWHKIIYMNYDVNNYEFKIKKYPLLLSRLLLFVAQKFVPKIFFVTGIDFYATKNLNKFWLPGYAIKESAGNGANILAKNKRKHDLESNKKFLHYCYNRYTWLTCDNLVLSIIRK